MTTSSRKLPRKLKIENRKLKTIGITGGIGSGKSYVSDILRRVFDIPVYDCDKEAKRLAATDPEIRRKLIQLVGTEVFNGQELVKPVLADFLFASPENGRKVNAIIHPAVLRDFERWAGPPPSNSLLRGRTKSGDGIVKPPLTGRFGEVCLESAILYESGFDKHVNYIIFVDAPEEVRLQRAMQRDGATEAQIRARMKMQHPDEHRAKADFVIDNSATTEKEIIEQMKQTGLIPVCP